MLKTGIIIQARMGSTRLPGKVLLNLAGQPVLWHIVNRCSQLSVNRLIIATSTLPQNRPIVKFCRQHRLLVFTGSETDVLSRYYLCAQKYQLDVILRVSGDCPLTDPFIMNRCLTSLMRCRGDFCTTNQANISLPVGLGASAFTFSALHQASQKARTELDREHVDPYIYAYPEQFHGCPIKLPLRFSAPFRLTLDEPADYRLLNRLFDKLYSPRHGISTVKVLAYLKAHPHVAAINQQVIQKT